MTQISVIMGVYNCKDAEMLNRSVDSIINQTEQDWELIICNDGSTDNTLSVLNQICKKDSRIRIISYKKNKGLAFALNQCIRFSTGRYIARQDDDDISLPNRFKIQLEFLKNHKEYSFVGSKAIVFDENGDWGEYKVDEHPTVKSFLWTNPFAHPTVMFDALALKKSGGYRVSKETRRCEDYDLFMRMYSYGYIGYNIQDNLYKYRIINDNKKYRPMKYRIDESIVRFKGYRQLGLLPIGFFYAIKPILIGIIPQHVFRIIRQKNYKK